MRLLILESAHRLHRALSDRRVIPSNVSSTRCLLIWRCDVSIVAPVSVYDGGAGRFIRFMLFFTIPIASGDVRFARGIAQLCHVNRVCFVCTTAAILVFCHRGDHLQLVRRS